jgi:ubiquinone/menaquinone biosynthesis C-methylase UbiE
MLRLVKRLSFKLIYKVYLWSSSCSNESFLGSRSVEYPFVIEELRKGSIPEGSKVLLVGCAGDPLSTILPALGYEVYGLDVKQVAIKYPKFRFIRGDVRKTNFPDNYFDIAVAVSTIEHVGMLEGDYEGDKKAIEEIIRILRPGGLCIVTCPIAPRTKLTTYERVYDPAQLERLFKGFTTKVMRFFKEKNGYWVECSSSELTSNEKSVCLISAIKRA